MMLVKLINGARKMKAQYEDMNPDQAREYMKTHKQGDYTLLDVREDWEYEEPHIPGAVHVPLSLLAEEVGKLPPDKPTIVYCLAGGRSSAAASMLKGKEFPIVFNLMGGMNGWNGDEAVGPATAGMLFFSGEESTAEVIALACRMEVNLGAFYEAMAQKTDNTEIAATLTRLAGFEEKHKTWLLTIYKQMAGKPLDEEILTASLRQEGEPPLEGGLTADEFMTANSVRLDSASQVVEAGMMFEAQALDLYMRYAAKAESDETRELLMRLADEEKAHLKALANLLKKVSGQ